MKRRFWSEKEMAILKTRYPREPTERVAKAVGRSVRAVYSQAGIIGLTKSPSYMATPASGRTNGRQGLKTRFKKGVVPWNKGVSYRAGGRSPETRFKRGNTPHTALPIGSYRITKDGTLQQKISDQSGNNSRRWRSVHELVWIEHNGPVPPQHIVRFRDGMKTNVLGEITIDKVECISLAENMRRNTLHRYPKEIATLIQLRGALNRQINRRTGDGKEQNRRSKGSPVRDTGSSTRLGKSDGA